MSVCWSVMTVSPAKMAEQIVIPFGILTQVRPRNHVLDMVQIPTQEGSVLKAKRGHPRACLAVNILKVTQQGAELVVWYGVDIDWSALDVGAQCTLVQPGEYD